MIPFVTALEDSELFSWGFLYDCMGKCICVTLNLFLIDGYLCKYLIVNPICNDRDHVSGPTSESSEKFYKTSKVKC